MVESKVALFSFSSVSLNIWEEEEEAGRLSWSGEVHMGDRFASLVNGDSGRGESTIERVVTLSWSWQMSADGFGSEATLRIVPEDMICSHMGKFYFHKLRIGRCGATVSG